MTPKKADEQLVLDALKRLRSISFNFRYGGLGDTYVLAKEAIEAFERMTAEQPVLFVMGKAHTDGSIISKGEQHGRSTRNVK